MELFVALLRLGEMDLMPHFLLVYKQLYWFISFLVALWLNDVETLMQIVYDDKHILPRHAHALAGRATIFVIRRYVAHEYVRYRILRDESMKFRHSLYDIWFLLPELRPSVDNARKEFGPLRPVA